MSVSRKPTDTAPDRNPTSRGLWTPSPWEVRYYEEDSAEYEDGLRAWVANHRRKEWIADVLDTRNGPLIAAAPRMADLLARISATVDLGVAGFNIEAHAVLREAGYR